jgi:iron-sulfur cluster repair protein YtfE (RIC family)
MAMDIDHRGLRLLLPDHHRRLDAKCQALVTCACEDDTRGLLERWREVEPELLGHMADEDDVILTDFARAAPNEARALSAEHAQLRALIAVLGADIARREVRSADLRALVDQLRMHTHHEEELMYPWAQRHLAPGTERMLFVRVCRWFGVASEGDHVFAT